MVRPYPVERVGRGQPPVRARRAAGRIPEGEPVEPAREVHRALAVAAPVDAHDGLDLRRRRDHDDRALVDPEGRRPGAGDRGRIAARARRVHPPRGDEERGRARRDRVEGARRHQAPSRGSALDRAPGAGRPHGQTRAARGQSRREGHDGGEPRQPDGDGPAASDASDRIRPRRPPGAPAGEGQASERKQGAGPRQVVDERDPVVMEVVAGRMDRERREEQEQEEPRRPGLGAPRGRVAGRDDQASHAARRVRTITPTSRRGIPACAE